jgi:hypothetical protein
VTAEWVANKLNRMKKGQIRGLLSCEAHVATITTGKALTPPALSDGRTQED